MKLLTRAAVAAFLAAMLPVLAQNPARERDETLRQYADAMRFRVGTLIQGRFWNEDPRYKEILGKDFNSAVSPVFMHVTQPERGEFDFHAMDAQMQFAGEHHMKLFGAALVYRNDNSPSWLRFHAGPCGRWSAGDLDRVMQNHIENVVRHGGEAYWGWEVVNEPLEPAHNGCWGRVLGQDKMIVKAFRYARQAAPRDAVLLLNETFGQAGAPKGKVDDFFDLLTKTKRMGAPIDAAGIEMHLEVDKLNPDYVEEFRYFVAQARKAGVEAHVTEMDVNQGSGRDAAGKQKEVFYNIARACLDDATCKEFTVWGLTDTHSWLRTHKGELDATPLLFDENYQRKPAYFGVLQAFRRAAQHAH
jgi:endo-1,4-beta-xylanase